MGFNKVICYFQSNLTRKIPSFWNLIIGLGDLSNQTKEQSQETVLVF